MQLRRPIATLMTALALFGGGATMTACGSPTTPNEGTTEENGPAEGETDQESDPSQDNVPDLSDPEQDPGTGSEDVEDG